MRSKLLLILPLIAFGHAYQDIKVWKYIIATIVTLFVYKKLYPHTFKSILGLNSSKKEILPFFVVSALCAVGFHFFIEEVMVNQQVKRMSIFANLLWFIQPLFQSFNEEVYFRAQYFSIIGKFIKNKLIQSLLFSIVFSLGHGIFFKLAFDIQLKLEVYLVLFVATIIMNHLYLKYQNIVLSWAIHFGINFSFFGGKYFLGDVELKDPEKFNLILGNEKVLLPTTIIFLGHLLITSYYKYLRKKP